MRVFVCFLLGLLGGVASISGQTRRSGGALQLSASGAGAIPAGTLTALQGLAARASVIFAGHVLSVDRKDAVGYVDVTFAIDHAVRGCGGVDKYVLREWAGLWSGEPDRYRLGARLLMLLPPRGASGMSEPVDGLAGAIPLMATRTPPLLHGTGVPPADKGDGAALGLAVDLRWVQVLATRAAVSAGGHARPELTMRSAGGDWFGPVAAMPALGTGPSAPGLSSVLALLEGGHGR